MPTPKILTTVLLISYSELNLNIDYIVQLNAERFKSRKLLKGKYSVNHEDIIIFSVKLLNVFLKKIVSSAGSDI